eukprot:2540037-Rhodomonas_salina.3
MREQEFWRGCTALNHLYLRSNQIVDEGASFLAGLLGNCKGLAQLELSDNRIGDEGARMPTGVMRECTELAYLGLGENSISAEGAGRLAEVLGECTSAVCQSEPDWTRGSGEPGGDAGDLHGAGSPRREQ